MPRETLTAPATFPLFSTSGASRTSTTSVLPLAIMSRACAGVTRGTAALAASIICLTLVAMASSSSNIRDPGCACVPQPDDHATISHFPRHPEVPERSEGLEGRRPLFRRELGPLILRGSHAVKLAQAA